MIQGEDIFRDKNDEFSGGSSSISLKSSPSERVEMIEGVFNQVFGRKPSSRELAYYKYGILKEDEIREKLLNSDEHKKIVEDASKLPNIEDELRDSRISERKLVQSREDLKTEMITLQNLLDEKNEIIKELRITKSNPYDLPSKVEKFEEGFDIYTPSHSSKSLPSNRRSFREILIDLVNLLFK